MADSKTDILNRMRVNQKARAHLQKIDEDAMPDTFFCAQLALSAIERGAVEAEEDVIQTLKAMTTWRNERIMNFLMLQADEEYSPYGWEEARDFRELAQIIVNDIENKMVKHFPWCRSAVE